MASTTTHSGVIKRRIMVEISNPFRPEPTAQRTTSRTPKNWRVRLLTGAALLLVPYAALSQSETRLVLLEGTIRNEAGQAGPNATVIVANERGRTRRDTTRSGFGWGMI